MRKVRAPRTDLTGQRFGALTVIRPTDRRQHDRIVWECRCDCGNTAYVQTQYLRDGTTRSCKACQRENRPKRDITGQRFGSLTALYPTDRRDRNQSVIWRCRCECGNEVEYSCGDLQQKNYISCGCRKRIAEGQLRDRTTHVAGTTVELLRDKKVRSDSTTGVTGVTLYRGRYKAILHFQKKRYYLGTYQTLEEAAAARQRAEQWVYGAFLDAYRTWQQRAASDPSWEEEHPFSVRVVREENGELRLIVLSRLEE